jgi:hypothetical protein
MEVLICIGSRRLSIFLVAVCLFFAMSDVLAQDGTALPEREIPEYIKTNTHPKLSPLLNDSTKTEPGKMLLMVEGNAKAFVDPMGYVISIIEHPMVFKVHFTPEKSWLLVDENIDVAVLEKEWLNLVRTPLAITTSRTNLNSPGTKE